MKYKKIIFTCIILPILSGTLLYLIKFCFLNHFQPSHKISELLLTVLNCWVCDFLWAFSLANTIFLLSQPFKHRFIICTIICSVFCVILEFLQKNVLPGTFDTVDIIIEIVAVSIALLINKKRKENTL